MKPVHQITLDSFSKEKQLTVCGIDVIENDVTLTIYPEETTCKKCLKRLKTENERNHD